MKMGVRYKTESRVVEFEDNRLIAWKTGPTGKWGRFVAGRIWRYELETTGEDTRRESWDITVDHQRVLLKLGGIWSGKTRRDMDELLFGRIRSSLIPTRGTDRLDRGKPSAVQRVVAPDTGGDSGIGSSRWVPNIPVIKSSRFATMAVALTVLPSNRCQGRRVRFDIPLRPRQPKLLPAGDAPWPPSIRTES